MVLVIDIPPSPPLNNMVFIIISLSQTLTDVAMLVGVLLCLSDRIKIN